VSPNDADMRNYKLNSSAKALSRSSALLFFWMGQCSAAEILAEAHRKNSTFVVPDAIIKV
jgi:hypothetical protein